tara:strand:- start:23898 stop:24155 length:258 start_codon:yes stop_codon:yes gene_type:complete
MHEIPKVTNVTLDSTLATLRHEEEYSKKAIAELKDDNPVLYALLEIIVNSDKDPQYIKGFLLGATQFYTLISRQNVSDELERIWG